MSASDSDYSIDWLASDDEDDNDSKVEVTRERTHGMLSSSRVAQDKPQSCRRSTDSPVKNKEARSGSPSFCSTEGELSLAGESEDRSGYHRTSESPKGKSRQAQKRPWSSTVLEQNEKQLTFSPTEKDRLFACKVRHAMLTVGFESHSTHGQSSGSASVPRRALITCMI